VPVPPLIGKPAGTAAGAMPEAADPTGRQTDRQRRGAQAEQSALDHLLANGLKLVARNVRYRAGEIDLIMRDGAVLVFVEVRSRADTRWGGAAASVDARKQRRLIHAAQIHLQARYGDRPPPCRFDIVVFDGAQQVEWLPDAFSA